MDADADEYIWMTCVLSAWRKAKKMSAAIATYQKYNGKDLYATFEELKKLKSGGDITLKLDARVWLAKYFSPVSEALWDGADDARAIKLWGKTKHCVNTGIQRELNARQEGGRYAAKKNTAGTLSARAFANGWLKKHDWKTVK